MPKPRKTKAAHTSVAPFEPAEVLQADAQPRQVLSSALAKLGQPNGYLNNEEVDAVLFAMRASPPEEAQQWITEAYDRTKAGESLKWLRRLLIGCFPRETGRGTEVTFTFQNDCGGKIRSLIQSARKSLDICMYTFTDDDLGAIVKERHRGRVRCRVITDYDNRRQHGSEIEKLEQAGIEVRYEPKDVLMHHKFAIVDGSILITGSYNWTGAAASGTSNCEAVITSGDPKLIKKFAGEFNRLWKQFGVTSQGGRP